MNEENYCKNHQGNTSHYDPKNCTVCRLKTEVERLERREFGVTTKEAIGQLDAYAKENSELRRQCKAAEAKLAKVEALQRYRMYDDSLTGTESWPNFEGKWVKWSDIQAILHGESEDSDGE